MTPKFTKGHWVVLPEEHHRDYIRIRGTHPGGSYKIANVCGIKVEGPIPKKLIEEVRANAALIAAAPELYEALLPFALCACDEPHVDEDPCFNCKARTALQKATTIGHQ